MRKKSYKNYPDKNGNFGQYGGRFVSETLMPLILDLEKQYLYYKNEKNFKNDFSNLSKEYIGRPSPLYFASNLTRYIGGAKIYFKRETEFIKLGCNICWFFWSINSYAA